MSAQKVKGKTVANKESWLKRNQWQLLLVGLVFIVFANSIFNGYNLDDELVTRNHRFTSKGLEAIPDILSNPYYADAMGYKYEYRPIVHVTFAIEHQFFGESAKTSHFFNLVFYALLCVVLYNLLKQLFQERYPWLPIIAAAIFAVHPIHTEVVCSIKNRDEILSLLFMLLAWKYALRFFYNDIKSGVFCIAFVVLSLLSKNTSFVLLLLIPLSTLLLTQKEHPYTIPAFSAVVLPVTYFCIPALQSRFYLIALALLAVSILAIVLKNRDLAKQQLRTLIQYLRDSAKTKVSELNYEQDKTNNSFLPEKRNGIILLAIAVTYLFVCALTKNPYLFVVNGTLILAASLIFRKSAHRLLPLLAALIIHDSFLMHYQMTEITELLSLAVLTYLFLSIIKKDIFGIALGVAMITALQFQHIEYRRLALYVGLPLLYMRTRKPIWLYIMAGIVVIGLLAANIYNYTQGRGAVTDYLLYAFNALFAISYAYTILRKQTQMAAMLLKLQFVIIAIAFAGQSYYSISYPVNTQPEATIQQQQQQTENKISTDRNLEFPELPIGLNPSFSIRFGTAASIFAQYIKLITIAYPLSYYYGYAVVVPTPLLSIKAFAGAALAGLLALTALFFYKRNIAISIGIGFFLVTIFPFLNIILPLPGMMADRFLLIPSIGFCIAIAAALHYFINRDQSPMAGPGSFMKLSIAPKAIITVLLITYSAMTIARNENWENHLVLFQHDIKHLDESTQAHNLLALQYIIYSFDQKDATTQMEYRQNAEKHFKRAIEIYPQFFNPHYDLGRLNEMMNRPDSALKYYRQTITIDSTFPTPYLSASRISQSKNDLRASISWLQHGLRFDTLDIEWYNLLSFDLYRMNDFQGSVDINKLAMRRIGVTPDLLAHIGQAYLSAVELDSARVYLEKANSINPNVQGLQGALQQLNNLQQKTPASVPVSSYK